MDGRDDGAKLGVFDGPSDRFDERSRLGLVNGNKVGSVDGSVDGKANRKDVGTLKARIVGTSDGILVCRTDRTRKERMNGKDDRCLEGDADSLVVGKAVTSAGVGSGVGWIIGDSVLVISFMTIVGL